MKSVLTIVYCLLILLISNEVICENTTVTISLDDLYCTVDEDFLSVTICSYSISSNWSDIDFTSTKVLNMAKALVPASLRIGGTGEDYLKYDPNKQEQSIKEPQRIVYSNYTMSPSQYDALNEFTQAVDWRLIFSLNQRLLNPNGTWNSTNAELLIDYTIKKNYTVGWELGNG